MSNIFGGVEPPAWLQEQARENREHGQWGQVAGTALAGFINGLQRDETAPVNPETGEHPRTGFLTGLTEARLNQVDPLWKLKATQAQVAIKSGIAQAESAFALARERNLEVDNQIADSATLSPWLAATPEQRQNMTPPVAKSQQGQARLEQLSAVDARYFTQKVNQDILRQRNENTSVAAKAAVADQKKFLEQLVIVKDPAERARIRGMMDESGLPTADAWQALSLAEKETEKERIATGRNQTSLLRTDKQLASNEKRQQMRIDAHRDAITQKHEADMELLLKKHELTQDLYNSDYQEQVGSDGSIHWKWGGKVGVIPKGKADDTSPERINLKLAIKRAEQAQAQADKNPSDQNMADTAMAAKSHLLKALRDFELSRPGAAAPAAAAPAAPAQNTYRQGRFLVTPEP